MVSPYFRTLLSGQTENTFIQLFRYTLVGGTAFVFDFASLFLLTHYGKIHYLLSAALAFVIGLTINYIISVRWVFAGAKLRNKYAEFVIFSLVGIAGLGLNELIIWYFTEYVSFHYLVSKIVSTVLVYLFNFSVRKVLLFR